jgi:tryptophan synthase alpha chain
MAKGNNNTNRNGNGNGNPIDRVFGNDNSKALKLMTHVVAGYPDMETTEELIRVMAVSGVDLIEIQIPFSDPLADGPTILTANQAALDNGVTPGDCFGLVERLTHQVDVPLLFMTYANIPFTMGMEHFIERSRISGVSGLIIPDLPFDENPDYVQTALAHRCYPIPVVSPGTSAERLSHIVAVAEGFIYTTLRVGITGARKEIDERGLGFLETLRAETSLPIAAGFGISSPEMLRQLAGRADAAVIGSHVINLLNTHGIEGVKTFLDGCI